jgi:transcriptional regulator with XRE-family HTH domain
MKTIIGNNLRYLRHFFDLTAHQMAEILNVSESHYRKIESKYNGITADKLLHVALFFEISMEHLLDKEENAIAKFIRSKDDGYEQRIKQKLKENKFTSDKKKRIKQ